MLDMGKKTGRTLVRLMGAALIAVVMLSLFALIYDNSGIKETNHTGATSTHWKGRQFVANMTEGHTWFFTDEQGFNNPSLPERIDVLFMGDSQIEARQVPQEQNVVSVMNRLNPERKVYNIGISGNFLNESIRNAPDALNTFHPTEAVIIDVSDIYLKQDLADMRQILAGEKPRIPATFESGPMYWIKHIPCVKPLLYGLKNWALPPVADKAAEVTALDEEYLAVLREFLGRLSGAAREAGVTPIIVFHPTERLLPDGTVEYVRDEEYFAAFATTCEDAGIVLCDLTEAFRDYTAREHVLLHGFFNTSAGEGHLNRHGHQVMAEVLDTLLSELEAKA